MIMGRHVVPIVALLFSILPSFVESQTVAPSIHMEPYSDNNGNQSARQDVCELQLRVEDDDLELRYALQGFQLHPVLALNDGSETNPYFNFDDHNHLDKDYPGLAVVLLDELAQRGEFTWRESFGVVPAPTENHTWTELLLWSTDYYDVSINWWSETLPRLKMGISFPQGWYDASYILVGLKEEEQDSAATNLWAFLEPYEPGVWGLIVLTVIVSAAIFQGLESLGKPEADQGQPKRPAQRLLGVDTLKQYRHLLFKDRCWRQSLGMEVFNSVMLLTQHYHFVPTTPASRLFSASMAIWTLLISATYTANLASFFVVQNTPRLQIDTIDDAVRNGLSMCVVRSSASALYVSQKFPQAVLVERETQREIYQGLHNQGECHLGIVGVSSLKEFEQTKVANPHCRLIWVGRQIQAVSAGFATKADAGKKCTSLIHNVLNLHMVEMQADGFLLDAWKNHLSRNQDQNCDAEPSPSDEEEDSPRIGIQGMAGTFLIHAMATGAAVLLAVASRYYPGPKTPKPQEKDDPPPRSAGNTQQSTSLSSSSASFSSPTSISSQMEELRRQRNEAIEESMRRHQEEMDDALNSYKLRMEVLLREAQHNGVQQADLKRNDTEAVASSATTLYQGCW